MEFRLPELAEGIDSGTVAEVLVSPGMTVKAGDEVLKIETDKATIPVTISTDGTVDSIVAKVGSKVSTGDVVFTYHAAGSAPQKPTSAPTPTASAKPAPAAPVAPAAAPAAPAQPTSKTVEFAVPELGDGISSAKVSRVNVEVGASFQAKSSLMEVETDKANISVEAPANGKVQEVRVKAGDTVEIGSVVFVLVLESAGAPVAAAPAPAAPPKPAPVAPVAAAPAPTAAPAPASAATNGVAVKHPAHLPIPAGPATRRLAREMGIELAQVKGTGRGGRITIDDLKAFVKTKMQQAKAAPAPAAAGPVAQPPLPDFAKYGTIEKQTVSKIRQTIAKNMTNTWSICPMVTQFDKVDITDLEAGRKRVVESQPKGAAKITMTVLAVKAVVAALKAFPHFNSSFDMNSNELILKKYFHVGIAVDTDRGLVVPVIRDADHKSIHDIAVEVQQLAEKARSNQLTIDQMRGGTFTITNLGGVGGTAFTPIVNWPEVAILGMARSYMEPVWRNGAFEPRLMLPLCLTYDHRVIDGADGARFTAKLNSILSDPIRLLMES
ncbi:2-oxo acid dehydrogenase subunit E2 [Tuwongella immobilis]|uniref:Dihydrolipoamide acetyltransferase component of pyruvate dehydrogenase complex n=1 Tax=Tuwongella immobilis TaxID=692036 RepID=A0A6C2YQB0_9BACT|nr:2-oxo acid dehydrogenase subunit E2 [Tuwongella immobilis]VIP03303.1 dihydrolipoamide acetyltransferase : Pyruvate dehydrogenase E2 component OS=Melioribacter roseus (strain JCM 17771 / P3M-2) GN=MROS_0858 PE=3 SV=1: Biotin_lipoyl: Biotin_lipoyl: E3_binding: 2-oxoacid_dh [Tuwongella immobilis]VTS03977.1 dihydrolipoamide acetyltransferase : Pyruvate dehydrogenase E2 component OS=Melioribacter roseus (strain JCM 17771 / P3M-2) GN=MROS_0858 PE=3 SV=1: Biotin_lipoyl: Biotin_lipoyl: E3_binding: 2-o